jgi:hypothetical protein
MLVATVVVDKDEGWRCEVHLLGCEVQLLALFALELLTMSSDATLVRLSCRIPDDKHRLGLYTCLHCC